MSNMKREAEKLTDLDEINAEIGEFSNYCTHYDNEQLIGNSTVLISRCLLAIAERLEWINQDMRPDRPTAAPIGARPEGQSDAENLARQGIRVDDLTSATGPMKAAAMKKHSDLCQEIPKPEGLRMSRLNDVIRQWVIDNFRRNVGGYWLIRDEDWTALVKHLEKAGFGDA